jgi:tRNA(Glu) U13 pseudouridine synthase TruD
MLQAIHPVKPVGRIKTAPEDFVVREIVNGQAPHLVMKNRILGARSPYTSFILTKRGIESRTAYREIARQLGINRSQVTDYGMKDAAALTSQMVVIEGQFKPTFSHDKMWLCQVGPADGPLRHGRHEGNHFSILVRTDSPAPPQKVTEFLNLFGVQRFGDGRLEVGRDLLEGNFEAAVEGLKGSMNWPELEAIMRKGFSALEALRHPDFTGTVKFKIQQWQSWMWNEVAARSNEWRVPVWSPDVSYLYAHLWNPALEQLHSKMVQYAYPFTRKVRVEVGNPVVKAHPEGFLHEFSLPPGVYATVYLERLYEVRDISREKYGTRGVR